MKKQILFVAAFYCLSGMNAQPVLNQVEDFQIGTKVISYRMNDSGVGSGPSGTGITWDFSSLQLTSDTIVQEIVHPGSTPYGAMFSGTDYVEKSSDGSYSYMQKLSSTSQMIGFVTSAGLIIKYHNPFVFFSRPFTYQDIIIDTSARSYTVAGDSLSGTGLSETIADGWGTLIVPGHTYNNVLRIKFTQEYADTSHISHMVTHSRITSYAWFDTSHVSSLLKIDSVFIYSPFYTDTVVSVELLKQEIVTHMITPVHEENIQVFYTGQKLVVSGRLQDQDNITVTICDMTGRKLKKLHSVQQGNSGRAQFDIPDLPENTVCFAMIDVTGKERSRRTGLKILR